MPAGEGQQQHLESSWIPRIEAEDAAGKSDRKAIVSAGDGDIGQHVERGSIGWIDADAPQSGNPRFSVGAAVQEMTRIGRQCLGRSRASSNHSSDLLSVHLLPPFVAYGCGERQVENLPIRRRG